jgi:acetyl esterase/lipase
VVTIHGGGWTIGVDAGEQVPFALDLVKDGIAVWNIEYRLLEDGGGWPMTFADVATAIDLLPTVNKTKARGRLDLGTVVTFGPSAGGHLAVWAVSRGRIPKRSQAVVGGPPRQRLRGALSYAGVLELMLDEVRAGAAVVLMGGPASRFPDRFAAGSPYALLPTGVPVICMHGEADSAIPVEYSRRYVERATSLGDPATLVTLPGVDHHSVTPIRVGEPLWTQVREQLGKLLG